MQELWCTAGVQYYTKPCVCVCVLPVGGGGTAAELKLLAPGAPGPPCGYPEPKGGYVPVGGGAGPCACGAVGNTGAPPGREVGVMNPGPGGGALIGTTPGIRGPGGEEGAAEGPARLEGTIGGPDIKPTGAPRGPDWGGNGWKGGKPEVQYNKDDFVELCTGQIIIFCLFIGQWWVPGAVAGCCGYAGLRVGRGTAAGAESGICWGVKRRGIVCGPGAGIWGGTEGGYWPWTQDTI